MKKWIKSWRRWMLCLMSICLASCAGSANIRANAPVCRVRFDVHDEGLAHLSPHNLRAILAFETACTLRAADLPRSND